MRRIAMSVLVCAVSAAQTVQAQVPVVESHGTAATAQSRSASGAAGGVNDNAAVPVAGSQVVELFQQLQALQIEVQNLRGLVEEQSHQLNRLAREQKEQYLDIDRRLSSVATGDASGRSSATGSGPTGAAATTRNATPGSERDAYTQAFDLTREKKFQQAIDGFSGLIADYPNGQYAPYSFYWLGELYLALPDAELENSRQSFAQVVNLYPAHQKVPDSLYKLGVVYDRLGETDQARSYLARVQSEYPDSPAARLARSYAAELR